MISDDAKERLSLGDTLFCQGDLKKRLLKADFALKYLFMKFKVIRRS